MAAPIDLTGQFPPSLTHVEQQHAQQMHDQQLQALRSVKSEDRQEYEEEHGTFAVFSQNLVDKWEQRFDALATLARGAGVSSTDIEAIRKQERQPAPVPTQAEGRQAAAEEQEHAQAQVQTVRPAASKPAAGKTLSKRIQRTVDKGEAAIDPAGDELTAAGLIIGDYVWGQFAYDGVWYPGEVLADLLTTLPFVRFVDGDQDTNDELEDRAWRRRKPPPPQQQLTQPRNGEQAEQALTAPAKRQRKSATAAAPEVAATVAAAAAAAATEAAPMTPVTAPAAAPALDPAAAPAVAPAAAAESAAQTNQARPTVRAPGKPMCKYGKGCYREHLSHWQDFDHPADHPKLAEIAQPTSTALVVSAQPNVQPPAVKDLRRWWDRRREDSEAAAGDAYADKPSDVPGPICILTFEKLRAENMCGIVSHLVWESCSRLGPKEQDDIFVAICAAFSFAELAALERTSSVSGKQYPSGNALGVDPARASMPKRYSPKLEAVIKKAATRAGLAGVMAVDLQDFLENVQKHTQSGGKLTLQWLRSLVPNAQKEELHSLLLVQSQSSSKVRHGLQFLDGSD